jgi:hypothetical protein
VTAKNADQLPPGSVVRLGERLVRRRLSAEDWDDAADLFEQGAAQAEDASPTTHSKAAVQYAVERMNSLALFATGKALAERKRAESANDQAHRSGQ